MNEVTIIGAGKLGGALAIALSSKGFQIQNLVVRNTGKIEKVIPEITPSPNVLTSGELKKISSKIIFITTQDAEIKKIAEKLAGNLRSVQPIVFHCSGALSSEILQPLKALGCHTASFHPLVSISDPLLGVKRFKGAYFCVEGDTIAVRLAKKIADALEGKSFSIKTELKTLYHASAVTACGHLIALIDVALEMLQKCGLDKLKAQEILLPLIKSTVENLESQPLSEALTGPFARADRETFEKHLQAFENQIPPLAQYIYLSLAERSTYLAEKKLANLENLQKIRDKISLAKKNSKC
jgi:predicted short-subunit dehydrogenase-like oxidoreductase (DUF2520 family)